MDNIDEFKKEIQELSNVLLRKKYLAYRIIEAKSIRDNIIFDLVEMEMVRRGLIHE